MQHGTNETCPWTYLQYFMHGSCYRSQNLSRKCLSYPHQQLGEVKSLYKVDSTHAHQWPKSHACSWCHQPSAALEKWERFIPWSHFNDWWVMDTFIWPSAQMTVCWMVCLNDAEERNCMAQWGYSESHACHVRLLKWTWARPSCAVVQSSLANITAHSCTIRWGWLFTVNNQNCNSMVSFYSRTVQHLITIMMCKIWCNFGVWEVLTHHHYSPVLIPCDYWLFANVKEWMSSG